MKRPIRVCIMHDHRLFSDTVTVLLRQQADLTVVSATQMTDFETMSPDAAAPPFDIALIDALKERPDALRTTIELKQIFPEANAIVVGLEPRDELILETIEAGASGYTLKNAPCSELAPTIRAVHHGQTPCSPRIAALVFARIAKLAQQQKDTASMQPVRITPREREILQLLACGRHNAEIAHQLGITLHTVKNHVHHLLDKFQARGRREVIQRAYERGMLRDPRPDQTPIRGHYNWV